MSNENNTPVSYTPEVKRNRGISPLWLLPIITLALAGWLVFKAIHDAGQRVQIYFSDAQGLVAGRTTIRYQGLEIGIVREIKLGNDLESIYVDADIYPEAVRLLSPETRFWLVKPTVSLSGVSGLDALVSGNYIALQPGSKLGGEYPTEYQALDGAPSDLLATQGLNIVLKAKDLGGISVGSQIVYKKIPIGEVYRYQLDKDAKTVNIQASIQDQYRYLITNESRFWNVSGIGASIGMNGVDVRLESFSALLGGAIAVDSPDGGEPVQPNTPFRLYKDLKTAGRGIPVKIVLPPHHNISASDAPIMYQGIEIGQITDLQLADNHQDVIASAAVQPAFSDMLNSGSQFILEEPKLSLSGVENLGNLIKGNFLTLVPGEGERARNFRALRKVDYNQTKTHSISLQLEAENSFGLQTGTQVLYRGIAVGSIIKVTLAGEKVRFDVLIEQKYAHLIRSQNRFYVTGSATAELTEAGLNVSIPPAQQLLTGSISFVSEGSERIQPVYSLYKSQSLAELAKFNQSGSQTLTLLADKLPSLNVGSPLLYRNLQVGSVTGFKLVTEGVKIKVNIENQYRHLITADTVFWNHSGVEIDASLSQVSVKTAPLKSLLQGGISFDSMAGVENRQGKNWTLYDDYKTARNSGQAITLTVKGTNVITPGVALRYQGIQVGEITQVIPHFDRPETTLTAKIQPQYVQDIAGQGSHFWLAQAKIGLDGVENLDSLLVKSISVKPGQGKATSTFMLDSLPYREPGVKFALQSEKRRSVTVGTPVLYRDIEVGRVTDIRLGHLADRVVATIEIDKNYAYLIRENTVFWDVSGINLSVGLTGADLKAGTLDSLVRGGIAFATPEKTPLKAKAKPEQAFYLYAEAQPEWQSWRTAIAAP